MKYIIMLSVCVGILGPRITVAAEVEIPKFDITTACRASGSVLNMPHHRLGPMPGVGLRAR
jgi:hypothetical protein